MYRYLIVALLIVIGYLSLEQQQQARDLPTANVATERQSQDPRQWISGQQVEGQGTVSRILPDDNDGNRHQRFILRLGSGLTLLVAHNIDLAPVIASLREGDTVSFYGEYESNDRGGVIHWTHHDPQGRHVDGWLEHKGQRYQ
jgi:hypothetical protein